MRKMLLGALLGLAAFNHPALAGLAGDTVSGVYYFPDSSTVFSNQGNQTVSPLATFTFATGFPNTTATVSDTQIVLTFDATGAYLGASFDGVVITDLTNVSIFGATVDAATTLSGFDASRLSFTGDSVSLNLQGLVVTDAANTVVVDVAAPEPVSMTLLGAGLLGLAAVRRRK